MGPTYNLSFDNKPKLSCHTLTMVNAQLKFLRAKVVEQAKVNKSEAHLVAPNGTMYYDNAGKWFNVHTGTEASLPEHAEDV